MLKSNCIKVVITIVVTAVYKEGQPFAEGAVRFLYGKADSVVSVYLRVILGAGNKDSEYAGYAKSTEQTVYLHLEYKGHADNSEVGIAELICHRFKAHIDLFASLAEV